MIYLVYVRTFIGKADLNSNFSCGIRANVVFVGCAVVQAVILSVMVNDFY